nr:MAG TPA: hypothetical protein [Caudoviricetes sp.]
MLALLDYRQKLNNYYLAHYLDRKWSHKYQKISFQILVLSRIL